MATALLKPTLTIPVGCPGTGFLGQGVSLNVRRQKVHPVRAASLSVTSSLAPVKNAALRCTSPEDCQPAESHSSRFDSILCMAKKSMIERDVKRKKLAEKFSAKREALKERMKEAESMEEKFAVQRELQQLPRNSAPNRVRNRCFVTGRPRAFYRDFGLSRHCLREMAHECLLPGVTKSSW